MVLGPSLPFGTSAVPPVVYARLPLIRVQGGLPPPEHFCNAVVQLDQPSGFVAGQIVSPVSDVVAGPQLAIRRERVPQELQRLSITSSKKPFADVEQHRECSIVHLVRQLSIASKDWPHQQSSHAVTLLLGGLPDAQILESKHTHA
jgi:hypothetical protein